MDGHVPYLVAVDRAFEGEIDYATLTKLYGGHCCIDRRRPASGRLAG